MEEICVNDYVRERGEILKIETFVNDYEGGVLIKFKEYAGSNVFKQKEIEKWKHSSNIIDVLEVGDIVTMKYRHLEVIKPLDETDIADLKSAELKLISVVTHESFNSIKYEVI